MNTREFETNLKDFRVFVYYIWKHLGLPDPTPVQYDIAEYLQNGPKRKIIEAFRGVGKSWITAAYVLWKLYWNPQYKILVVSASKERADSFSTFTLRLINDVAWLQHLRPNPMKGQRNSKISFDIGPAKPDQSPSVKSVGIFGQLTGSRADVIIADDIEVPNNSFTQGMRDKLAEAVKEFDSILKPDEGSEITYLGTPQTEMSLYNIIQERGYSARIWPARVPSHKERSWYGERLAPIIAAMEREGTSTEPVRFSNNNLLEREASYGRSGFALQFMLNTSLSDKERFPLKLSDVMVMSLNDTLAPEKPVWSACPETREKDLHNLGFNGDGWYRPMAIQGEWRPYEQSVMFVDPSGRGKDETAWAIMKSQGTNIYLVAAGGHRFGYDSEGMTILLEEAKKHKVQQLFVEANFGDGMFTQMLKAAMSNANNDYACTVEEARSKGQKELRIIDTCEPILNQHRLIVDRKVIEQDFNDCQAACFNQENGFKYSLFWQMSHISKDRGCLPYDDRLDAFAGCLAAFIEIMDVNQERLMQAAWDKDREAEFDIFLSEGSEAGQLDMYLITGDAKLAVERCGRVITNKRWVNM